MIYYTASSNFFGFDYSGSNAEFIGDYRVEANSDPVDVSFTLDGMPRAILPTGAYIIRYVEGSFLIMDQSPTFLAVGGESGLQVGWCQSKSSIWTKTSFPIDHKAEDATDLYKSISKLHTDNILQLELTRPHRLQLIPPQQAVGHVKVKIMRFASKMLNHQVQSE